MVLAASYEARAFGVRSGMAVRQARSLCPTLVTVPTNFDAYLQASEAVMELCRAYTPSVEQISIDEAFLDVSAAWRHFGAAAEIAQRLRADIRAGTLLPSSVGAASSKFLAKVASRRAKPDGLVAIPEGSELEFLHPLPVDHIWGVGPVVGSALASYGILTVGDLASVPRSTLEHLLGVGAGRHLHALAWNLDPRGVVAHRRARSVGAQSALGRRRRTKAELETTLLRLADRVGRRLRARERTGTTLTLRVRYEDLTVRTARTGLGEATAVTSVLYQTAARLLEPKLDPARIVTLLGISVSGLTHTGAVQPELPFDRLDGSGLTRPGSPERLTRALLDASIDSVRLRFGREALRLASISKDGQWPPL